MNIPNILLETKDLRFLEVKSDPVEKLKSERAIVHYISTNDLDRVRDIMNPKGMRDDEFNKTAKSVWYNHNYKYDPNAMPIGRNLWLKKKDEGVLAKTQFADTDFADDVYRLHEGGFISTWSIGFTPVYDSKGNLKEGSIRFDDARKITYWEEWKIYEYSSAPIPANVYAVDVAKSLLDTELKSYEAKRIVEEGLFRHTIEKQFSELSNEFQKIKEIIDELKATEIFDSLDRNEKTILTLKKRIEVLESKIEPVEALGNLKRFREISSEIIGDAVRKHIKS